MAALAKAVGGGTLGSGNNANSNAGAGAGAVGVSEERLKVVMDSSESSLRGAILKQEHLLKDKVDEAAHLASSTSNKKLDQLRESITTDVQALVQRMAEAERVLSAQGTLDEQKDFREQQATWRATHEGALQRAQDALTILNAAAESTSVDVQAVKADAEESKTALSELTSTMRGWHIVLASHNTSTYTRIDDVESAHAVHANAMAQHVTAMNETLLGLSGTDELHSNRFDQLESNTATAVELLLSRMELVHANLSSIENNSSSALARSNGILSHAISGVNATLVNVVLNVTDLQVTAASLAEDVREGIAAHELAINAVNSTLHERVTVAMANMTQTHDSAQIATQESLHQANSSLWAHIDGISTKNDVIAVQWNETITDVNQTLHNKLYEQNNSWNVTLNALQIELGVNLQSSVTAHTALLSALNSSFSKELQEMSKTTDEELKTFHTKFATADENLASNMQASEAALLKAVQVVNASTIVSAVKLQKDSTEALDALNVALTNKVQDLQEKISLQIQNTKTENEKNLRESAEISSKAIESLKTTLVSDMQAAKLEQAKVVDSLKAEQAKATNEVRDSLSKQITTSKTETSSALQEAKDASASQFKVLRETVTKEMQNAKSEQLLATNEVRDNAAKQLRDQATETAKQIRDGTEKANNALKTSQEAAAKHLKDLQESVKSQVASTKAEAAASLKEVRETLTSQLTSTNIEQNKAVKALTESVTTQMQTTKKESESAVNALSKQVATDSKQLQSEVMAALRATNISTTSLVDSALKAVALRLDDLQSSTSEKVAITDKSLGALQEQHSVQVSTTTEKTNAIVDRLAKLETAQLASGELSSANREKVAKIESSLESLREQRAETDSALKQSQVQYGLQENTLTSLKTRADTYEERGVKNEDLISSLRDRITKLETLVEMLLSAQKKA